MLNVQKGLTRISAVWWGFCGLLALLALLGGIFGSAADRASLIGVGAAGLIGAYFAHRVTCWVVAGFFAARS